MVLNGVIADTPITRGKVTTIGQSESKWRVGRVMVWGVWKADR